MIPKKKLALLLLFNFDDFCMEKREKETIF